jgi:tRNA-Thr(GGU) m(6)t(6)A37 methyltransferase TsaA
MVLNRMEFKLQPIGIIRSPFIEKRDTPIQPSRSTARGTVEVYPEFADGLRDLESFSHIILIYYFHQSSGYTLSVKPFLDTQERGLFATRYPARPNQIGISIVRLMGREDNLLDIEGVDVLDGTPLLDIKPYVPDFDIREDVSTGWYSKRKTE